MFAVAHLRAGNDVEIATIDDPKAPYLSVPGCGVHALGPSRDQTNYHYSPELQNWLQENYLRFYGVDINGIWQCHVLAARRAFEGRRPYVVFTDGLLDPIFESASH